MYELFLKNDMKNYELTFNLNKQISVNKVTMVKSKSTLTLKIELKQNLSFKAMQNQNVRFLDQFKAHVL